MALAELGNKFSNVIDKVRNERVGNEAAWETAQPLLEKLVSGYPEEFKPDHELIKEIFFRRRDAYRNIDREPNSQKVRQMMKMLSDSEVDFLSPVFVVVRDLFDIAAPGRRTTRNQTSQYKDNY